MNREEYHFRRVVAYAKFAGRMQGLDELARQMPAADKEFMLNGLQESLDALARELEEVNALYKANDGAEVKDAGNAEEGLRKRQ